MSDLSAEDTKLLTLARAARARASAAEGAAVRDENGRTYAAGSVALSSLRLTAVQVCVAMALASGSTGLEAVVVLGDGEDVAESDLALIREFAGAGVIVHRADARGTVGLTRVS